MILRPYQEDLVEKTRWSIKTNHRAPLIVSPCGSGKTVMFSYFAKKANEKGNRVLILAHRIELVDQISATLSEFSVDHSFIAANRPYSGGHRTHVASVMSAVRRIHKMKPPNFIIIDESHHCIKGSSWSKILDAFPCSIKVGVTASPERLSGEGLGNIFDDLIMGPSVAELIRLGALSPYKIYSPTNIDLTAVRTRMGDYVGSELSNVMDKPSITGDVIKHYKKFADGKRAITFCTSVKHAKHVAEQFRASGYNAYSIDGTMDAGVRKKVVQDFRKGVINVLTSCDLISEGFDLPAIEAAIMLRPTKSLALWIQQSGRSLRPSPGKSHAIILDHAGNCRIHGLPDDERQWSLEGRSKHERKKPPESLRVCPKCFGAQRRGSASCSYCQHIFEIESRQIDEVEGELSEIDLVAHRKLQRFEQGSSRTLQDLMALGKKRGYRNPYWWAQNVIKHRTERMVK